MPHPGRARPRALDGVDGVLIPGGFGVRGIEGKIGAIRHARTRGIPTLGLCLGLQCMVIEAARDAGRARATPTPREFDERTPHPVISTMADQQDVVAGERDMGGTMRLGAYPAVLTPGSIVAEAYGAREVSERHRHRYEVNNAYRERLERGRAGLRRHLAGRQAGRVRRAARDVHPFFVGTQAHPELKSRPTRPHPLFAAFVKRRAAPTAPPTGCRWSCPPASPPPPVRRRPSTGLRHEGLPCGARAGHGRRRHLRRAGGLGAAPAPLRGGQRLPRPAGARPGWCSAATSPDGALVEFVELPSEVHPFFVGTQAHPELKSRPTRPHPLFTAFVRAALRYRAEDRLPVELPAAGARRRRGQRSGVVTAPRPDFPVKSTKDIYTGP